MANTPKVPVAVLEYEPSGFEQKLIKHKSKLILVGVLALAGTAGYFGYNIWKDASNQSAAVDFVRASSVQELKAVAEKHPGKAAGGGALILAAERLSAERPGEAIDLLKDFLSKYPDHPLRGLAEFRIAEYFVLSNDAGSAEKQYETVSKANSPFSYFALLRLGDMKWAAGDATAAQGYYDRILKSSSPAAGAVRPVAKDRMENALKAKAPVLVDYKEEPPGIGNIDLGNLNGNPATPNESLLPPPKFAPFNPNALPAESPVPPVPPPGGEATPPVPPEGTPKPSTPPAAPESGKPAAPESTKPATPAPAPGEAPKPAAPAPAPAAPDGKKVP
ncbi:MAG TPA: tetratricopeptide repeat protein [Verrucomicrobiales bacterium]|nr:tetratricopeptide repeat protein [Verrucomicrobiales bacterium]